MNGKKLKVKVKNSRCGESTAIECAISTLVLSKMNESQSKRVYFVLIISDSAINVNF